MQLDDPPAGDLYVGVAAGIRFWLLSVLQPAGIEVYEWGTSLRHTFEEFRERTANAELVDEASLRLYRQALEDFGPYVDFAGKPYDTKTLYA